LRSSAGQIARVLPLFSHDDGRILLPTARSIWDKLVEDGTKIDDQGLIDTAYSSRVLDRPRRHAEKHGEP
jgi:hypothetical protein